MKKFLTLFFGLGVLVACAQTTPTSVISFIGANPTFDSKGNLLSAPAQARFLTSIVVNDQTYLSQENVTWDGTDDKTTVTADGITATLKQITDLAAAAAVQAKAVQDASAKADKTAQ